jgi:hypothetical protein
MLLLGAESHKMPKNHIIKMLIRARQQQTKFQLWMLLG